MIIRTHYKIVIIVISKPTDAIPGVKHSLDIFGRKWSFCQCLGRGI